jgi:hypothetical protein
MRCRSIALTFLLCCFILLVACAPQQATTDHSAPAAPDESSTITLPVWTEESDCATCHDAEVQSGADAAATFSLHAGDSAVTCMTCHADEDGVLARAHEDYGTAEPPTKLKRAKVQSAACLSCHDQNEIRDKTVGSAVLTDNDGTIVNPHELPANDEHTRNITCVSCHEMHATDPVEEVAPITCRNCHHMDVYECGTCHE